MQLGPAGKGAMDSEAEVTVLVYCSSEVREGEVGVTVVDEVWTDVFRVVFTVVVVVLVDVGLVDVGLDEVDDGLLELLVESTCVVYVWVVVFVVFFVSVVVVQGGLVVL
jgi:hypothetical protein